MNEFIYRFMNESEFFLGTILLGIFVLGGISVIYLAIKAKDI